MCIIAVIVLGRQQWPHVRLHIQRVVDTVNSATPGSFAEIDYSLVRLAGQPPTLGVKFGRWSAFWRNSNGLLSQNAPAPG
jgi:hypothetical protein